MNTCDIIHQLCSAQSTKNKRLHTVTLLSLYNIYLALSIVCIKHEKGRGVGTTVSLVGQESCLQGRTDPWGSDVTIGFSRPKKSTTTLWFFTGCRVAYMMLLSREQEAFVEKHKTCREKDIGPYMPIHNRVHSLCV